MLKGDWVYCIDNASEEGILVIGEKYQIDRIYRGNSFSSYIEIEIDKKTYSFYLYRFESIREYRLRIIKELIS